MTATDQRHGTLAGYRAGCRRACCRDAINRYNQQRLLNAAAGRPTSRLQPARGTSRRLQALTALGWSAPALGRHLSWDPAFVRFLTTQSARVDTRTADRVAQVYDQLSMRLPPETTRGERQSATRARNHARRNQWAPPLAWDDIDLDAAPHGAGTRVDLQQWEQTIDHVMVQRVLDHEPRPRRLTHAEAAEAVARLRARGLTASQIENEYGLKPRRYAHADGEGTEAA